VIAGIEALCFVPEADHVGSGLLATVFHDHGESGQFAQLAGVPDCRGTLGSGVLCARQHLDYWKGANPVSIRKPLKGELKLGVRGIGEPTYLATELAHFNGEGAISLRYRGDQRGTFGDDRVELGARRSLALLAGLHDTESSPQLCISLLELYEEFSLPFVGKPPFTGNNDGALGRQIVL
jgi:hypothetical protein